MKKMEQLIPKPKTKFLLVKCQACGAEQTIFSAAATKVKCLACGTILSEPGASSANVSAKILREFM